MSKITTGVNFIIVEAAESTHQRQAYSTVKAQIIKIIILAMYGSKLDSMCLLARVRICMCSASSMISLINTQMKTVFVQIKQHSMFSRSSKNGQRFMTIADGL